MCFIVKFVRKNVKLWDQIKHPPYFHSKPIKYLLAESLDNKETLNSIVSRSQGSLALLQRGYVHSALSAVSLPKGVQGLIPWKILIAQVTWIAEIDWVISSKKLN